MKIFDSNRLLYSFEASTGFNSKIADRSTNFSEADPSTLKLSLEIAHKDNATSKLGNLFKHGRTHDRTHDMHYVPKIAIPKFQLEYQEFNMDVHSPKGLSYNLFMKWKLQTEYSKQVAFTFIKDQFKNYHTEHILNDCNAFDLKNVNLKGARGECIGAQHHVMVNRDGKPMEIYKCEVLHIPSIQWSSIRILSQDEMDIMSTSNLIGLAQLPMKNQMQDQNYPLDLDPKFETAMLIKNSYGDFAIVKGKWSGFRRGVPPKARGQRGTPGDPGHLQVLIYFFDTKSVQRLDIPSSFKFDIKTASSTAKIDLQNGKLNVSANDGQNLKSYEVENLIATVLSISTIHVLRQPKPSPYVTVGGKLQLAPRPAASTALTVRGGRPVRSMIMDDYLLFSMIGYYDLVGSPCFMHNYEWQHHHHDVIIDNNCDSLQPSNDQDNFCGIDTNDGGNDTTANGGDSWIFNDCDGETTNDGGSGDTGGGIDSSGGDYAAGCGGT